VDPQDPGSLPGADRHRGQRALPALIRRQGQRLADKVLVGDRGQDRPPRGDKVTEPAGEFQRVPGVLAEIMRGIDEDPVRAHSVGYRALRGGGEVAGHVAGHVGVPGAVRSGTRGQPASMSADQPCPVPCRDGGNAGVGSPGVVDQVRPGLRHGAGYLGAPGVHADHHAGMRLADGRNQADDTAHLLGGADLIAGAGLHPADVHDVGARRDRPPGRGGRLAEAVGGTVIEERVRGAVDHGHDRERSRRPLPLAQPERSRGPWHAHWQEDTGITPRPGYGGAGRTPAR
jgi:hypothetical protein